METTLKQMRISEIRALENEKEMILEGYAVVFDKTTDLGWCKENIDRKAFEECDMSDCVLKYNHNDSCLILARTRNKSLELIVDNIGLKIRAKLIDTTNNRDIYKMVNERLLDKMSFAFKVEKQKWDYETDVRTILKFSKIFDVSIVDFPAYEDTEIFARDKNGYEQEKRKYKNLKIEKLRTKLKIQLLSL